MLASNSVSTIFRCMSCSFGTHDQSTYAEHIKHCSNESSSETLPVTSDVEEVQNNSLETVKKRSTSYICTECHLPSNSSRELLIHLRDVHGKAIRIFVCKFCSSCASQHVSTLFRHARKKHSDRALKNTRPYIELYRDSVIEKSSANSEVNADVQCFSAIQTVPCEQEERSISDTVISSKSLGLNFLGRQLRDIGCDEFVCVLCSFSHIVSHVIVRHIWKDHRDKVSEVTTENASMTNILYKCDDCSYSTREKLSFYNHCSHHQFNGPSKCPHCSFCALTVGAINLHVYKYHAGQLLKKKPKSINVKISAPCKVTKTGGNSPYRKLYKNQQGKKKCFECPHCPFKSTWHSSVYNHKVRVHPELMKKCGTISAANNMSSSPELNNAVEMNANSLKAEQLKPPNDHLLSDAMSTPSTQNVHKCEICSTVCKSLSGLQSHKQKHLDIRPYQCTLCGLRGNYMPNIHAHIRRIHKNRNAKVIKLSLENAKQTIEAYRQQLFNDKSKKVSTDEMNSSCNITGQQNLSNDRLFSDAGSESIKKNVYECDICSRKFQTMKVLKNHKKKTHLSFGCYQCSLCGFRSNYQHNINKHICRMHRSENAEAIKLSLEDAKQTIEAYRKQPRKLMHLGLRRYQCPVCGVRTNYMETMQKHIRNLHKDESKKAKAVTLLLERVQQTSETLRNQPAKPSHSWHKRQHCTASVRHNKLLHPADSGKSRAVHYSMSTPNNNDTVANSSESSVVQSTDKQPRLDNAETSHSSFVTSMPLRKKRHACFLCKFQTYYISSIYRHVRNVHHDKKARAVIGKRKMSVHQSEVARHTLGRKTVRSQKVKAETPVDNREEHDDSVSVGAELAVKKTVKSELNDMPGNRSNIVLPVAETNSSASEQRSPRKQSFSCDICPYRSSALRDVTAHRKLHVKRSGYSFACNICPYFTCQASHLERHKKVHARQSTDVEKKVIPDQEVDSQKSEHKATRRFFCDYCPYMSVCNRTLISHKQHHHPRTSALIKCELCDFWVTEPCYLSKHEVVHTAAYMKKRMQHSSLLPTSVSLGNDDIKTDSEKYKMNTSHLSASDDASGLDGLQVRNTVTTDIGKQDETSQSMSVNDSDECTVNTKQVADIAEENVDVSARSMSSTINRQLPSWCCERCPYLSNRLACFKRHVWLHGKQYPYECQYCDYSVESYWQLVSHVLWHFAPNKHLVYAQPVSNLDSFPSQLPNRDSVPDSLASIDSFIPSFENSDVFLLSDASNFRCHCCPFVTEQRSEFFSHMLCHCVPICNAAYSCPFCNFHTDLEERFSIHVFLHFNLPGCQQSSLPPNTCDSDDWKQLAAAIEALTHHTESHCVQTHDCDNLGYGVVEAVSSLDADNLMTENKTARPSDCEDDLSVEKTVSMLRAVHSDNNGMSSVPHAVFSMHCDESVFCDKQRPNVTAGTVSAATSPMEEASSAKNENITLATLNKMQCCRYCDRVIDDPAALTQHETRHLVGYYQHLHPLSKILLYGEIY